jgi:predicted CoA-binding protein
VKVGAKILWTQLGIWSEEAAEIAQQAGITVIMDRCPAIEYRRLGL